jgi:mono/diheme cytochrome c family protein
MRPATVEEIKSKKAFALGSEKLTEAINFNQAANSKKTNTVKATSKVTQLLYTQLCSGCHGVDMKGLDTKPGLLNPKLVYGNSFAAIKKSVLEGSVTKGMPAWKGVLSDKDAGALVNFILSKRK